MSQRDLVAELRGARVEAPVELRARVRAIAAADTAPPRRRAFTWRRALVLALPVAAAVAAAVVVTRPANRPSVERAIVTQGSIAGAPAQKALAVPSPSTTRVQRYGATLSLQVPTAGRVSDGVKKALAIVTSLGGYATSVHASTAGKTATADLTLKVPRLHVQQAVARLSTLGTITAEHVDVQDLQAGLNAGERLIARLQRQLKALRAQPQTVDVKRRIAALTARIERLQRAAAATRRSAHYATVQLHLETPPPGPATHRHGPLHGLVVAFTWAGIGAIYALALGMPALLLAGLVLLAVRLFRRRREDALLSRP